MSRMRRTAQIYRADLAVVLLFMAAVSIGLYAGYYGFATLLGSH